MFNWLFKKAGTTKLPKPISGLEFRNVEATKLIIWVEPYCIELTLEPATEYRIEADGTEYLLEFSKDYVTLCLNNGSAPKVLRRPYSLDFDSKGSWELDTDYAS